MAVAISTGCALAVMTLTATVGAQARVYRCAGADGSIEFRQQPCPSRQHSRTVTIEDTRTGWVPLQPEPQIEPQRPPSQQTKAPSQRAAGAPREDQAAERCWRKRQQIQRIDDELRAGYRPARGERLKARRRQHEAYVDAFCP